MAVSTSANRYRTSVQSLANPGSENPVLYRTLKDVLERQAEAISVWFEPDAIQKRYLVAEIGPQRVVPPPGVQSVGR